MTKAALILILLTLANIYARGDSDRAAEVLTTNLRIADLLTSGHPFDVSDVAAANEYAEGQISKLGLDFKFKVYVVPMSSFYRVLFIPTFRQDEFPAEVAGRIASDLEVFMTGRVAARREKILLKS